MAKEYICTSGCLWYGRIFLTTSNYSPPDPHPPPRTPKKALPSPTFLSQQLLLAKNINFCQSFFSMISCEKTKKTLQRARNNALLIFLHHPKTSFFLSYYSRIYRPKSGRRIIGGRGESFWTVNHRVNWFSYVLEVPWIRRCLYISIYLGSLQFSALITTPPTPKYFSKKNIPSC